MGNNNFNFLGGDNFGNYSFNGIISSNSNITAGSIVTIYMGIGGVAYPTSSNGYIDLSIRDSNNNLVTCMYEYGAFNYASSIGLNMSQTSYNVKIEFIAQNNNVYNLFGIANVYNAGGNTRGITIENIIWRMSN